MMCPLLPNLFVLFPPFSNEDIPSLDWDSTLIWELS